MSTTCDARNYTQCPCTNTQCERHGKCCACVAAHGERGNIPACLRKNLPPAPAAE